MKSPALLLLSLFTGLSAHPICAQRLQGHISAPVAFSDQLTLLQARGTSFQPVDSVRVGPEGDFKFPTPFTSAGFYQLALHDTDRVDLILDGQEATVDLEFDSIPMADHVHVRISDENKALWEYKYISRETEAVRSAVAQQRLGLQPSDTVQLNALDKVEERAVNMRDKYLKQLEGKAPSGYFAKILRVDRAVQHARGLGPMAVVAAFDFSDPDILHSTVYDKAVMAFMQNLNAISDDQFSVAADSLMALSAGNPDCHAYMLGHLIDLFVTYGPEAALQHVIEGHVAALGDTSGIPPVLKAKIDRVLQVSVGKTAPDIQLNDHGTLHPLAELVGKSKYTALFFYSSTCEHCHAQMPTLKADRSKYLAKGFQVIAIALDVDSVDFLKSIQENDIPWKCYSEFNGWGAKAAKAFLVQATPTFFLLDQRMKIVAKPTDAEELRKKLRELL